MPLQLSRGFLAPIAGNVVELRWVQPRPIVLDVIRTFAWSAMPVVDRVADAGNRSTSQTGIAEQIVALHLLRTDRIISGRRGALDPLRFPARTGFRYIISSAVC